MIDREKVIEAYKICIDVDGICYDCPYYIDDHIDPEDCDRRALRDILELLEELEDEKKCCRDCEYFGNCHS